MYCKNTKNKKNSLELSGGMKKTNYKIYERFTALTLALLLNALFLSSAHAAAMTSLSDTMSRLADATASNHTVKMTLGTSTNWDAGDTLTVTFDSGFGLTDLSNTDATDYDINTGIEETIVANGSCASTDAISITSISGQVITFTACPSYSAPGNNSTITIEIGTNATTGGTGNTQITNPATTGTKLITLGGTIGDTGTIAIVIIDDEQIPVTASVNPTISFTVANTALSLGLLDSGSISTSSYNNITIGTNGSGGYTVTIRDSGNGSNPGLYNTGASKLIASADALPLTAGSEGYGGQCNKFSGSGTCTFTGTGDNVDGFLLTDQTFASYGSKPTGTDTFQIRVKAAISTSTDAGSYVDTLTLIGTANF